jgi:hypothetical protein
VAREWLRRGECEEESTITEAPLMLSFCSFQRTPRCLALIGQRRFPINEFIKLREGRRSYCNELRTKGFGFSLTLEAGYRRPFDFWSFSVGIESKGDFLEVQILQKANSPRFINLISVCLFDWLLTCSRVIKQKGHQFCFAKYVMSH